MNSRMDTEKVYAPLRGKLWLLIMLVGAMVMCAGACMRLLSKHRTDNSFTERHGEAQAPQDSEQRLKAVVYGSPIPTFVIDRDHKLFLWNKALEEISGIEAGEVIGTKRQWKAFYNEERPCLADLLVDRCLERITDWSGVKCCKSKLLTDAYEATDFFPMLGNEGKWLHFTAAAAIRDSKGDLVGAVETLQDITERKRAEESLKEAGCISKHPSERHTVADILQGYRWSLHRIQQVVRGVLRQDEPRILWARVFSTSPRGNWRKSTTQRISNFFIVQAFRSTIPKLRMPEVMFTMWFSTRPRLRTPKAEFSD